MDWPSGAWPGLKHTPTAPSTAGNLTDTDEPAERRQLLGQVPREQP